jgi:hypothetical protein
VGGSDLVDAFFVLFIGILGVEHGIHALVLFSPSEQVDGKIT